MTKLTVCFNVTPSVFEPGGTVVAWAEAVNPISGRDLVGLRVDFYPDGTFADFSYTGTGGVATFNWTYPDDGKIHTIMAKVHPNQNLANVTLAVEPVTLSVGVETRLFFMLGRESTSTLHVIYGGLVRASDNSSVPNQTVKLNVNGTAYTFTTNETGWIRFQRQLQPVNGTLTIYQIQASFEGIDPKSANLTAKDPFGQEYAVCTTIQYNLRPTVNSVVLRVTPQGTDADIPTKTPEEMQKEAEQSGYLRPPRPWFSIWFPWFRLHFVAVLNGEDIWMLGSLLWAMMKLSRSLR